MAVESTGARSWLSCLLVLPVLAIGGWFYLNRASTRWGSSLCPGWTQEAYRRALCLGTGWFPILRLLTGLYPSDPFPLFTCSVSQGADPSGCPQVGLPAGDLASGGRAGAGEAQASSLLSLL